MIGMTQLVISSTSKTLLQELNKEYKPNNIISEIEMIQDHLFITFPTTIHNEEKETVFEGIVQKIIHLKDPADKVQSTLIEARYLQQASKEYYFSRGNLIRYRGFVDTDNPLPMVSELLFSLKN